MIKQTVNKRKKIAFKTISHNLEKQGITRDMLNYQILYELKFAGEIFYRDNKKLSNQEGDINKIIEIIKTKYSHLKDSQKCILYKKFAEGKGTRAVALELGLGENTVSSNTTKSLKIISNGLNEKGIEIERIGLENLIQLQFEQGTLTYDLAM